ncbi:MAG TPA: ATP-binding protein [Methylomirabilota bacterium]|jgi:signal transduction histidine kinase|nr:ATP-binding protein [Methylomirabilota bacterium]
MTSSEVFRPRGPRNPEDDAIFRARRRESRLRQEVLVRVSICVLILAYNEILGTTAGAGPNAVIRTTTLLGLALNGPYYLAARTGRWSRIQAHGRMLVDVTLLTVGLFAAGGLAAAPYVSVYAIVPVYAGIVLSTAACIAATLAATAGYLAIALLQQAGWLPVTARPASNAWEVAAFNLLVLNVVGGLTATLCEAYRRSRRRLAVLYQDLERAYDETSRLNSEMQRTARLHVLGEVVAGVTHEIGNALQGALLPIDLVRAKVSEAVPGVLRHLDQIEYGCTTAIRIVRNVLQTARQSSEETVPVSLADVARRTIELKGYDIRRDGIAIQLDFPHEFPQIMGPPLRLQQVFLNLVTNAQHALRDGSRTRTIEIVGSTDFDRAIVEVRDTGPGIPPEILPRLFEPFYTTKVQGTGLGLAISVDIIRGLGGELTARNRPEGGAIFRMSLPVAPPAAAVVDERKT